MQSMLSNSGEVKDFDTASPLAGLGYGLPISRCTSSAINLALTLALTLTDHRAVCFYSPRNYARYFGGDLTIMSMESYGTDSFIFLPRISSKDSTMI